jgi:hypothetical protein
LLSRPERDAPAAVVAVVCLVLDVVVVAPEFELELQAASNTAAVASKHIKATLFVWAFFI